MVINSDYKNQIIKKLIQKKVKNSERFFVMLRKFSKEFKKPFPTKVELLKAYRDLVLSGKIKSCQRLEVLLRTREVRSLSGIASITVITSPNPQWGTGQALSCPGNCLYCPNEPNMPKSYMANEPACMRAVLTKFSPYKQVETRLNSLELTGHATDKIELIVLGGTWSVYPKNYQTWFIKRCFDACNTLGGATPKSKGLKQAQKLNEKAKHRIVGLTLETRPDYLNPKEIKRMRWLGCTRVEMGVQSIYNDVLKYNRRGHNVSTTIKATKLLKDAGFKVTYHIMLNLPGSTIKKDEKMFDELFSNPPAPTRRRGEAGNFRPDQLKIYPCAVLKSSPLYKLWKQGKYKPYSKKQLINLLIKIKEKIPPYVRIIRIIRDIPSQNITAGNKVSNLRQVVAEKMKKENRACRCIRCREPKDLEYKIQPALLTAAADGLGNLKFRRRDYDASGNKEIFLSFEDIKNDKLLAFLRLRITNNWTLPELKNFALIRELQTYGRVVPIKEKSKIAAQHKGLGKKLMKMAERIINEETNLKKIAVISGVGVREYYRKLGYRLKHGYMMKKK